MCIICSSEYSIDTTHLTCCEEVKEIPKTLVNLEVLRCDKSQVKNIPDHLVNLRILSCCYTSILEISPNFKKLTRLQVRRTQVTELPESFGNLLALDCSNTFIKALPKTYYKLLALICSGTLIEEIPKEYIWLRYLSCYKTFIKHIPEELSNLTRIHMYDTNISTLSSKYTKITSLYASNSQITSIPNEYCELTNLSISNMNMHNIANFTKLRTLYAHNVILPDISSLTKLIYLHISVSNIKQIPRELNELVDINVKFTEIKEIDLNNFKNLDRVSVCRCVRLKGMTNTHILEHSRKHIKVASKIQNSYRKYRFRRNIALARLSLPIALINIISKY